MGILSLYHLAVCSEHSLFGNLLVGSVRVCSCLVTVWIHLPVIVCLLPIVVSCVRKPAGVCTLAETLPNVTKRVTHGVCRWSRGVAAHWDGLATHRGSLCSRDMVGIH